ncbi:hypothetical protein IH979_02040 [Patescibacteria group bacterium]|nr:hypothetical protein [Patescibacteria group bacterium]
MNIIDPKLKKFQPTIVGITGSVGKTSTKQAIQVVLSTKHSVRTAKKNYNNEIGVPLTILGADSPGRSLFGWVSLFWRSYRIKTYPDVLVLEFGADHPGDIAFLCDLAPPKIGVVTGISTVHAEFFGDVDELAQEKVRIVECLPESGTAVLNIDDIRVSKMHTHSVAPVKTYGLQSDELSARDLQVSVRRDESFEPGEAFAVTTAEVMQQESKVGTLKLQNCIGYAPVMACLAALQIGDVLDVPIPEAIEALNMSFHPSPGRLNPIAGIKGSLIIDDSYNAAPTAMQNGLKVLAMFVPGEEFDRRIAVLGEMAELGKYTQDEHRLIGMQVAESAELFVAVGEGMRSAVRAAKEAGMDLDKVEWFGSSVEAGLYLDKMIQQGDIVYIKGSQSSRMERVVKDIMAEPLRAEELLVRQEPKWLKE